MKRAQCPSCGAEVLFRSAVSVLAVCEYCRSTLLRKDLDIENLGRMAELMEDASPIQLGTQGRYRQQSFTVIGRIQLRYEAGLWNEWHIFFDNERTGWLGETPGACAISFLDLPPEECPLFDGLRVGERIRLQGRDFRVTNLEKPRCIAGEGELPFRVGAGYDTAVADLRGPGNAFATLDYSEWPPLCFIGEQTDFESLALTQLREVSVRGKSAKSAAFQCTQCGAPLAPKAEASLVIACGSCGSVLDLGDEHHKILYHTDLKQAVRPLIPLGSRGRWRGRDFEVVGFLRRETASEGIRYTWSEYLLFDQAGGFAWLSEYDGHWNYILPTTHQPVPFRANGHEWVQYQQRRLRHFQDSEAGVAYVLGEFYWRVQLGESASVREFVDPPWLLSEERMERELLWSVGEYVQGEELRKAFGVEREFPEALGVYANQPSPWQGMLSGYWLRFGVLAAVLVVLQIFFVAHNGPQITRNSSLTLDAFSPDGAQISQSFELQDGRRPLEVDITAPAGSQGINLQVSLVDADRGTVFHANRSLRANPASPDSGSRLVLRFADIPAGRYYLAVSGNAAGDATAQALTCTLKVRQGGTSWGNFMLALLALGLWPAIASLRHNNFETTRWLWSDHPPERGDG